MTANDVKYYDKKNMNLNYWFGMNFTYWDI